MNSDILQLIKYSGNPQAMAMNLLNQSAKNNPMMSNVLSMVQNGNINGVEEIARNLAKEKGVDINTLLQQINSR